MGIVTVKVILWICALIAIGSIGIVVYDIIQSYYKNKK